MTLDEYLTSEGIQAADFGARVSLSAASISRIRKGEQNVTRDVMRRIIAASDCKISAAGLVHGNGDIALHNGASSGNASRISTHAGEAA